MKKSKTTEKCCGACCWFIGEDHYGYGMCPFVFGEVLECGMPCGAGDNFISHEQARHHRAVLIQANRYRRDQHVPAIYKMPDPKELGEAIDFAAKCIKVLYEL